MEAQAYQHWTVTYEKNDLVPDAIVRCAFYASTLLSITVEMNNAIKGMGASRKRGEYAGSMLFELWVDRRPDVLVDRRPSTTVYRPGAASRDFPKNRGPQRSREREGSEKMENGE